MYFLFKIKIWKTKQGANSSGSQLHIIRKVMKSPYSQKIIKYKAKITVPPQGQENIAHLWRTEVLVTKFHWDN